MNGQRPSGELARNERLIENWFRQQNCILYLHSKISTFAQFWHVNRDGADKNHRLQQIRIIGDGFDITIPYLP